MIASSLESLRETRGFILSTPLSRGGRGSAGSSLGSAQPALPSSRPSDGVLGAGGARARVRSISGPRPMTAGAAPNSSPNARIVRPRTFRWPCTKVPKSGLSLLAPILTSASITHLQDFS